MFSGRDVRLGFVCHISLKLRRENETSITTAYDSAGWKYRDICAQRVPNKFPPDFLSHPPSERSFPLNASNNTLKSHRPVVLSVSNMHAVVGIISPRCFSLALIRFELDEERVSPTRTGDGVNHVTASLGDGSRLDGYVIVSTTSTHCGRQTLETIEARQLIDGGRAHIQVKQPNYFRFHPLRWGWYDKMGGLCILNFSIFLRWQGHTWQHGAQVVQPFG